ncbi:MAG: DUF4010 domain-containing protein [Candidatus Diapherotrites archaeon]|nr:DUF4010 domain-containing protein [Candidatus Diapherotrites archaeon]
MIALDPFVFVQNLILALAVGALIGIEREFTKKQSIAGLRTFSLVSLFGALSAYLSLLMENQIIMIISYISIIVFAFAQYIFSMDKKLHFGLTTLFAFVITFLAGALVFYSFIFEAVLIAILITIILFERAKLHSFVSQLTYSELADGLEFIIVAFLLYTFIPVESVALYGISFPLKKFITFIFFVSIVSFLGFLATRLLTSDKTLLTVGFSSGLISSSVFAIRFREVAQHKPQISQLLPLGLVSVFTSSFIRNIALISFFSIPLVYWAAPPFIIMFVFMAGLLVFLYYKAQPSAFKLSKALKLEFQTPFSVKYAFKVGLIFGAVFLAQDLFRTYVGFDAFILTSLLFSLVSSSAVISSIAFFSGNGTMNFITAALLAIIVSVFDMISKTFIACWPCAKKEALSLGLYAAFAGLITVVAFVFFIW